MYYSLVGDIVNSKKITMQNRKKVQNKLNNILNKINETVKYEKNMEKKLNITLGDEFQGLFKTPNFIFEIIHKITFSMAPQKIRFAIGIGSLYVNLTDSDIPFNSDGEVWWCARESINEMKEKINKQKNPANIKISSSDYHIIKFQKSIFNLINNQLSSCYIMSKKWTNKQRNLVETIIKEFGFTDSFTQKELTEYFTITESTIQEKLQETNYYHYYNAFKTIELFLIDLSKSSDI